MKKNTLARIVATAAGASALLIAGTAQAALQDRDLDGNGEVDAFYDTDFDITWLRNADVNGEMDWNTAMAWADGFSFAGYDDWRLPSTLQPDATCSFQWDAGPPWGILSEGSNCTGSEMGHLWHVELGNPAGGPMINSGNFQNLKPNIYWSGTEHVMYPDSAWSFTTGGGEQFSPAKHFASHAMAVRTGDVPAIPEPQTYALMLAGLGALALVQRRRRST